jgi:hypothetical protein
VILTLLAKFLAAKLDAEAAKAAPIGGEVLARKAIRGLRAFGGRWEIDFIARRTE